MLKEENGKNIGFCKCGFKRTGGIALFGEDINKTASATGSGIAEDENHSSGFFNVCEKCGFESADSSNIACNESEITIFTCLRCGHKKRQAQGSSKA